jgi:hypothetical protein
MGIREVSGASEGRLRLMVVVFELKVVLLAVRDGGARVCDSRGNREQAMGLLFDEGACGKLPQAESHLLRFFVKDWVHRPKMLIALNRLTKNKEVRKIWWNCTISL